MSSTRSLVITILVLALIALAGAIGMLFVGGWIGSGGPTFRVSEGDPATAPGVGENMYADFYLPEFELADQDGNPVDESILEDEVTVVDFFFTTCPLACPGMNAQMQRVQEATEGTGVRLLGISVSGDYDTPEVLRAHAAKLAANPERWRLLTGEPGYVAGLVREGLRFEVAQDDSFVIDLPGGETMSNIQHPTKLLLIGPDRRVIDMASYQSSEEVGALIERAREAAGG